MDQGIMTLITAGLVLAGAACSVWVLYTVIWRAVRRGMQEYDAAAWDPEDVPAEPVHAPAAEHHARHLRVRLPHRVPADDVVPDYPPEEWF
jgi:hypothetical protein